MAFIIIFKNYHFQISWNKSKNSNSWNKSKKLWLKKKLTLLTKLKSNDGGYKNTALYGNKTPNFIAGQVSKAWPTMNW